jgi:hypothetical protein
MTKTATGTAYQVRGTTSDVTECQICGKPDLRRTVILGVLDADGNTEDVTYAGTTCAAKVTGRRTSAIRDEAIIADARRNYSLRQAREIIATYGPVEGDKRATRELFFDRNPGFRPGVISPFAEFKGAAATVAGMLADARATLAGTKEV